MCLAIVKPKNKEIPIEFLENAFQNNPDGAGVAYFDGQLKIVKGLFKVNDVLEIYKKHIKDTMLIHFRWATHGEINIENCHPFSFGDGKFAAIHNGILPIKTQKNESDSAVFVNLVLEPMVKRTKLTNPAFKYLLELAIGSTNKIAVLTNKGYYIIFNEQAGQWKDGVWYSNDSYSKIQYTFTGKNNKGWDYIGWDYPLDESCVFGGENESFNSKHIICDSCLEDITDVIDYCDINGLCVYCNGPTDLGDGGQPFQKSIHNKCTIFKNDQCIDCGKNINETDSKNSVNEEK